MDSYTIIVLIFGIIILSILILLYFYNKITIQKTRILKKYNNVKGYILEERNAILEMVTFIKNNLGVAEISSFISKYFPESIPGVIYKYTDGIVSTILIWIYVLMFAVFLFYTVRILWKKR